jgi:glutaredoxin
MIKLFGTPQCAKCIAKKKELEETGIEFIYYDLSDTESKEVNEAYREAIAQAVFDGKLSKDSGLQLPFIVED